jgi:phosphotransferase system HPr (HPr) family protein
VAAQIAQLARSFRSRVHLQFDSTLADATSVLSLILLEAGSGSRLSLQAAGEDEHEAIQALEGLFANTEAHNLPVGRRMDNMDDSMDISLTVQAA